MCDLSDQDYFQTLTFPDCTDAYECMNHFCKSTLLTLLNMSTLDVISVVLVHNTNMYCHYIVGAADSTE